MPNSLHSSLLSLESHPCFHAPARHTHSRIHLPVAPRCNVQCRFCDRKYSCVNESRPGVTAKVMSPQEALEHLKWHVERLPNLSVVGIAGPGDPFANADLTLETLRLVRAEFPSMLLCVSSNGLGVLPYVDDLRDLEVSHTTITVNAVDPEIGARIYEWFRWEDQTLRGPEGAALLWERQRAAIRALVNAGMLVKVNTVCVPGINDHHVERIAQTVASLGVSLHNVIPMIPTPNTAFADLPEPSLAEMSKIRAVAQKYLPQMTHCARCRADAVGLLGQPAPHTVEFAAKLDTDVSLSQALSAGPSPARPYVAVATQEGLFINKHLGESRELRIYDPASRRPKLVDIRTLPAEGPDRWVALAELLSDCSALLSSGVGPVPRSVLARAGVAVHIVEGAIPDRLAQLASLGLQTEPNVQCGTACQGDAQGCG
ncbi:MAG TPA: nitrogenase cofactor biosynthesis protein NifB [Fibrobacteraceae bacterium]|nr:nitrogenase cofactor biosynthesis protein NifB [Fibrobacteraceae bacterium]